VNALANPEVGKYLNDHFVSAFQKVSSFKIVQGQKQGGNVASYFCLPDGKVIHAIAGPVNAETFLTEAKWVVDLQNMASLEAPKHDNRYVAFIRHAHTLRVQKELGVGEGAALSRAAAGGACAGCGGGGFTGFTAGYPKGMYPGYNPQVAFNRLSTQGKVNLLFSQHPLAGLDQIYKYVFTTILGQTISTLPVDKT
jgi:hypothetical protein